MLVAEPPNIETDTTGGLMCPVCHCRDLRVLETREGQSYIRRRRECRNCKKRITTTERVVGRY